MVLTHTSVVGEDIPVFNVRVAEITRTNILKPSELQSRHFRETHVTLYIVSMNRTLLSIALCWAMVIGSVLPSKAQYRLSVDVTTVQVAEGKKVTTERALYLHPDGRMVAEQFRPVHLISLTNALGEMRIYDPKSNEVAVMNDKEMASSKEVVAIFASGAYVDMGLPLYGFSHTSTRREGENIIKTFTPKSVGAVAKVELVLDKMMPICMLYFDGKGEVVRKVYFSKYEYGRVPMPMRITEIEYTPKRDSIVRLSTYSNLLFGAEATSEMFDYEIPKGARRTNVDPSKILSR